MLDGFLDEAADDLVDTERYERTADHNACRAGHRECKLMTTSHEIAIRMSKPKGTRSTVAVFEHHQRRRHLVEEAMMEMCLASASIRRIEAVSEILLGSLSHRQPLPASTKSLRIKKAWRNNPLKRAYSSSTWVASTSRATGEALTRM